MMHRENTHLLDMAENDDSERRTEPRISAILEALIDDEHYSGRVFPVSAFSGTGAFLRCPDSDTPMPAIGSVLPVQFNWPRQSKIAPVFVEVTVVRHTSDGFGVKFDITA
jgi:hypothetical protein